MALRRIGTARGSHHTTCVCTPSIIGNTNLYWTYNV
jgi:hypothetical protein